MTIPKLAVIKFASCDGCQLTLLNAEEDLLTLAQMVHIAHFAEASSLLESPPYDLALVEGSITTSEDVERLKSLRANSRLLVTIGACATAGGIQALKNFADHQDFMKLVYAKPEYISTLATSTPISDHVKVDFELRGCPIDKSQLIEVLIALAAGQRPRTSTECVCQACKRRGTVCVVVAQNQPCLGPVTQAGCNAICPAYDRGCYGCFGPSNQPGMQALTDQILLTRLNAQDATKWLRSFNPCAPQLHQECERLVQIEGKLAK